MVDPHDLAEDKQALCEFASTRYALSKGCIDFGLRGMSPSDFYKGKINRNGEWTYLSADDLDDYWPLENLKLPAGEDWLRLGSYRVFDYPIIETWTALPDPIGDTGRAYFSAVETVYKGEGGLRGLALLGDDTLVVQEGADTDISWALPTNWQTETNRYTAIYNRMNAEYCVNEELVAVAMQAPNFGSHTIDGPPYTLIIADPYHSFGEGRVVDLLELHDRAGNEVTLPMDGKRRHSVIDGDPQPPRTYRLYDWKADTLLTSGTYDTGTSHKSHPIPIQGYSAKAFLFQADTDSTSDGLAVEVLTQEGNWRTYLTRTYSANTLESIEPTGEFPLMRLAYEPSADGASITDAEATVR